MYTPYISLSISCNIPVLFGYKLCYTCFSSQSCMFMYVTCLSLQILVPTLLIIMCIVIIYTQNAIQFIDNVHYYVEYLHDIPVVMDCSNRLIDIYKSNMMACYQTQIILIILHVCSHHKLNYVTLFHMTCRHLIPVLLLLLVRVYDDLLYYYSCMRNTYLCHPQAHTYDIQIFLILRYEEIRSYLTFLLIIIYSTNEYINQAEFYAAMTFYSTPSTLKSLCIFLNVDHRPYWELLLLLYAMFKSLTLFHTGGG